MAEIQKTKKYTMIVKKPVTVLLNKSFNQLSNKKEKIVKCASLDPQYKYDLVGNLIEMTDPTGTTHYEYDSLNRLKSITNPSGKTITFEYDKLGRRIKMQLPNGIGTNYTYDASNRLLSIVHTLNNTSTIDFYKYTYDRVGNRTSMTDLNGTHNYIYDELYRLIEATHPIPELPHENYVLDSLGNRITSHISSMHVIDKMNRLLEDEKYIYTYDNNGNQISKKDKITGDIWQYTFNAENKLMQVTRPDGSIVKFKYDGLGRRYEKEVIDAEGNTVSFRRYYYDGEDILFEADADGNLIRRYTHGPGIDEPLILEEDTNLDGIWDNAYYYIVDGLDSVKKMVDESGNIVKEYEYDTYGNIMKETGTLKQPYTYTGREWDKELSLIHI